MNKGSYITIGLGTLLLIFSILFFGYGLSAEEGTSTAGKIGWFIGGMILAVPTFIVGLVLVVVGIAKKK